MDFDIINSNKNLTAEAITIYTCLALYADKNREAYPSVDTLLKLSRMSKTRFYKHMEILVSEGIVKKIPKKEGNLCRGVVYQLQDFRNSEK